MLAVYRSPHMRLTSLAKLGRYSSSKVTYENISPSDFGSLNRTSVSLYRLLLRQCRKVGLRATEGHISPDLVGRLMLQPPVNPSDPGRIRKLDGVSTWISHSDTAIDGDTQEDDVTSWRIITFFHRQANTRSPLLSHIPSLHQHLVPNVSQDGAGVFDDINPFQYLVVSPKDLVHAVRSAFLRDSDVTESLGQAIKSKMTKEDVLTLQRRAIDAIPVLNQQLNLSDCTSIGINKKAGVRVIATSKFKGTGMSTPIASQNVFVYRIRIENINDPDDSSRPDGNPVQLLGRTWRITDNVPDCEDVQVVDAPRTGVVGYHPVLRAGDSFEYMSGCNITSATGSMEGKFHMAAVDFLAKTTTVGENIEAFEYPDNDERLFCVPVAPFHFDIEK